MVHQINIFLLLFGGLQGLLLATLLFRKRAYRSAYIFLIGYILVMIVQVLFKVVSKAWLIENIDFLYFTSYQLPFLYGPLVYLLAVQLCRPDRRVSAGDAIHFVPFVLTAIATFLNFSHLDLRLTTGLLTDFRITVLFHTISIITYHYLAYREQSSARIGSFPPVNRVEARWLRGFIIASGILSLSIALGLFFLYMSFPRLSELRWIFAGLTLFIYWITYQAISQPEIFAVIRGGAGDGPPVNADLRLIVGREKQRYGSSGLSQAEEGRISSGLGKLMTVDKLYLDPDISLDKLAEMIGCSRHHLSQVMNEKKGLSFYEYINRFRVDEARQQLADPNQDQKIASIAYASGFNSLSAFNEVFKKISGTTPSDYRKQAGQARRKQV